VADADYLNRQLRVRNGIENAIVALADPIEIVSGELLAPYGPWLRGKRLNAICDPAAYCVWQTLELFGR
jgi:hypothetical protein